jgi:hypothetical protein
MMCWCATGRLVIASGGTQGVYYLYATAWPGS